MMATPKNKVIPDLPRSGTTITRSGRPSRSPERYRHTENEIPPIARPQQHHLSPIHQNTISCSSEDGDSEMQLQVHKDDPATGSKLWSELPRLRRENTVFQERLREAEAETGQAEEDRLKIGVLESKIAAQEATIEANETELDATKTESQSLQETIDRLLQQLQLTSQNTQNIQDELDDVKTKSIAEEATTLDKLKKALTDIRHLQDANKTLSQIIRDMEIGREAMDKERQGLAVRSQNLERDLERAEQDYREVVAHNERLKEENLSVLQQIKDATERERRNLQLIQDLEQEIRHNVKGRSEADLASVGRSETSTAAFADRVDMSRMSDQVGCRSDGPESSPAVHRRGIVVDISMGSSAGSNIPCEDCGGKQEAFTSAPSSSGLQQQPEVCASTTDTPETTSAVQRITSQSAADMDDMSTDHLPSTETPARRRSGRSAAGGNKRRTVRINTQENKRQTRESPPASSNATVSEDFEKRADVACSARFAPQPSPPPSNGKDTPREFSISQSYAKQGLGHVPLRFCPAQGDLSGECFNPYAIRLTPRGERTLVVTDADVDGLPGLLAEMTKHIPPVDDNDLVEHLRGGVKPIEDLHLSHSGGITGIVNSLSEKETYHRYAKTFIAILKYSLMAVQRFCQGDAQFNVTAEHEFKFKFHSSDREMLDACQCLHRLCSDLHLAQAWNGRHLQLYTYLWMATEKKDYFVPAKRPWRYDAILRQLTDPHFILQHQPSTKSFSLGQSTWLCVILDLLSGHAETSDVRRALGYDDSYGSSSSAGQPLTPTSTPWLKRKRDVHAMSDADASESTPCPKKRRLDDDADLPDFLQSVARTRSINSQFGGEHGKSVTASYSDPATPFHFSSLVYLHQFQLVVYRALLVDETTQGKKRHGASTESHRSDPGTFGEPISSWQISTTSHPCLVRDATKTTLHPGQRNAEDHVQLPFSRTVPTVSLMKAMKRKFDHDGGESHPGTSPRKRARFFNDGHMPPSSATACPISRQTEEHVSQWDWSSLQDCDNTTEALGHADFPASQTNATGERSISGFQDVSPTNDGRSILPQLPDTAWNATRDNGISLDNMPNLVTGNLPSDAPLDLRATSCSPGSQRLMSGNDAWLDGYMEDIVQQNCDFFFSLQDDYNCSSVDVGLQGEPQQAHDSPSLAVNVQDIIQQDLDESACGVQCPRHPAT